MTYQRKVILDELRGVTSHPTADEIYQIVKKKLSKISMGTVYRNLEVLSKKGLLQKIDISGKQMRFDGNVNKHYHVRCIKCGRVDDIFFKPLEDLEKKLQDKSDFLLLGHSLELSGLCPECK